MSISALQKLSHTTLIATVLASGLLLTETHAVLLAYEGFATPGSYTANTNLEGQTGGGTGFVDASWSNTLAGGSVAGSLKTETSSLSFGNLVTTDGSAVNAGDRVDSYVRTVDMSSATPLGDGSEIWISALVNIDGDSNWSLTLNSGVGARDGVGFGADTAFNGGGSGTAAALIQNQFSNTNATITNGSTNFFVARVTYTAANPIVDLWVNDLVTDFSAITPGDGTSSLTRSYGNAPNISSLVLYSNQNNTDIIFDEIRVGTSMNDVITVIPEPSFSAFISVLSVASVSLILIGRRRSEA